MRMGIFKDRKPPTPNPLPSTTRAPRPAPAPHEIESAVDEAVRRGEFDNLPGRGRPLDPQYLNGDPDFLAQKLLRDNGFVPEWVAWGRTVDRLDDQLRDLVAQGAEGAAFDTLVNERNQAVRRFNRLVPFAWQQRGLRDSAWFRTGPDGGQPPDQGSGGGAGEH